MSRDSRKAYVYALSAVFFWSTVASAFKLALRHLSVIQLLLFSSLVSTVFLFSWLLLSGRVRELREYSKNDYLSSFLLGALNPAVYYIILFEAYSLLPAQQAQPLNFTWSIILVLLSIPLLKQRIRIKHIIALFISFFGVLIIASEGRITTLHFENPLGVFLALVSAFFWAVYWLLNARDKREPVLKLFLNFCFGTLIVLIIAIITGELSLPSLPGIAGAVYVGLFEMGLTFVLWIKALKLAKTTAHVSILIFLSPFLSFLFINIFVGEEILVSSVAGLAFIVAGIIIQKWNEIRNAA